MQGCSRQAVRTTGRMKLACDLPLIQLPQHMLWDVTCPGCSRQASRKHVCRCSPSETRERCAQDTASMDAAEDMKHAAVTACATFECAPSYESQVACNRP